MILLRSFNLTAKSNLQRNAGARRQVHTVPFCKKSETEGRQSSCPPWPEGTLILGNEVDNSAFPRVFLRHPPPFRAPLYETYAPDRGPTLFPRYQGRSRSNDLTAVAHVVGFIVVDVIDGR
jgi:hypothetical protein